MRKITGIKAISFDGDQTLWDFQKVMHHSLGFVMIELKKADPVAASRLDIDKMIKIRNRVAGELKGKIANLEAVRLESFKQALKDHNIEVDDNIIVQSNGFGYKDGFETMGELLKKNRPLTALMAFNDITAIGAMENITDHGLKVPDGISVVGFDDIEICSFIRPRLTTIHFPKYKIAEYAVKMLLKKINNPEKIKDFEKKVLPLRLVVRDSTAKARE